MTASCTVWQKSTEKSENVSLFGFLFLLTARRDPSVEGKYDFFIQVVQLTNLSFMSNLLNRLSFYPLYIFCNVQHSCSGKKTDVGHWTLWVRKVPDVLQGSDVQVPRVLWHCWLGGRRSIRSIEKIEWWGTGVVICLQQSASDMHMAQVMPLPTHQLLLY